MTDPASPVRTLGEVTDIDGLRVRVGVDFASVSIDAGGCVIRLGRDAAEAFARLYAAACWAAGERDGKEDAAEAPVPGNPDCPRCSGGNPNSCSCLADCGYPVCSARPPED